MNGYSYTGIVMRKIVKIGLGGLDVDSEKVCDIDHCVYHSGEFRAVLLDEFELPAMVKVFKVLGDTTRLKIMFCLLAKPCCVAELCHDTGLSQSLISHQLSVLKKNDLVEFKKNKNKVIYTLKDEHVAELIKVARDHIDEKRG